MNKFSKKPKFLTYPADKMENYLYKYVTSYEGKTSKYIKNYFGWDELDKNNLKNIYSGKAFRPSICILVCTSFSGTLEMALPPSISVELVYVMIYILFPQQRFLFSLFLRDLQLQLVLFH